MPKKAFLNLSPEKKETLYQQAMQLYVDHPYEEVTLQMLLSALSLNPASFYRYFEDKDELYLHIQAQLNAKIQAYLGAQGISAESDIFTFYEGWQPLSPLEIQFTKLMFSVPDEVCLRSVLEVFKDGVFTKYKTALRNMRYEDQLRDDVDEDLIAFMYATTSFNLHLYFKENNITDYELQMKIKKYFYTRFFRHGIIKSGEEETESANNTSIPK